MHGLDVTFQTLARSHNVSVIDVLIGAINDGDKYIRRRALAALLQRTESRCAVELLSIWDRLDADNVATLKSSKRWLMDAVVGALKKPGELTLAAIKATRDVELYAAMSPVIELAESHRARSVRHEATEAVLTLAKALGFDARNDRDMSTVRRPIIRRLDTSVRCLSMHRNEHLVDAFLMASTWSDSTLRTALDADQPTCVPLHIRLEESQQYGVVELLTGFLRRRKFSPRIARIIRRRPDELCREALLQTTTNSPSGTLIRNLNTIGLPMSCRGDEKLMRELPPERRAALAHVHIASSRDITTLLHVIATAIELGGPGCVEAGAFGLSRCDVPDFQFWLEAALIVADADEEKIEADDHARLLSRLIDLLNHGVDGVSQGAKRVLGSLHAGVVLPLFDSLDEDQGRRMGRVVMTVDSAAIAQVRDGLRHPVLKHRIAAINAADALAAVDMLVDLFEHISHEDHQEARIRAAQAMSQASSDQTLDLLREMTELPDCAARDAAVAAFEQRQSQLAK